MGIILMFLWSLQLKAQTPNTAVLTWDQQVGCIRYDDKVGEEIPGNGEAPPQTHVNLIEGMMDGNCPRFCEGSRVNFTLQGNTIASVQWQATGGTLQPGSTNSNAVVQWGSSGNGSLTIIITYTDNTVKTYTVCIEKILSPHAEFLIDGIDPHQKVFCANNPISFNNISHDNGGSSLVNYLWDFGDGNFSNTFEPTHTYVNSGGYVVRLKVTNSCNCSSTYEYDINVEDAKPIEITCLNVTCEGNMETYHANDNCGGDWEVVGGTIVGGGSGSQSVSVVWDQVDPADGFGYISYRSHCNCPHWNTVKIPVILRHAQLQGPQIICQGKQAKYSLPQWPTTDFKWRLNGDPNHPMIVYTDQRNEIIVDGMNPGTYYIDVEYNNTLLGTDNCKGRIEGFVIEVVENVSIIAPNDRTICTGPQYTFDSSNGQPVFWEVRVGGTVVHTDNAPNTSYTFNTGGTYVVTATYNGCTSEPVVIEVIPTPVIPVGITGPDKVCLDVPYIYSIGDDDPGAIFVWSVTGGNVIGSNAGNEVAIAFNTSTATVTVVKQYVKNGVICTSAPANYSVSEVVVTPTITNNSGLSIFCPSDKYTFTANLNGVEVDHLEWEIVGIQSPGVYTTNFGSIISGMNSLMVEVALNEISNNVSSGELRLKVTKCGITVTKTVPIQLVLQPTLTLAPIPPICPGPNFDIVVYTSAGGGDVYVDFGYGNTGPYTFASGVPFLVTNGFSNTGTSSITKTITVELVGVCKYNPKVSQSVIVYPETSIEISPGYNYIVCPATGFSPITLTANMFSGIGAPATYQWMKNGADIPSATGSSYTIQSTDPNPGGIYRVRATNSFGCIIISDAIEVTESCGGSTGGCSTPPVNVTASWSTCNQITANVTYGGTPVSITWTGSQHLTLQSGQGTANAVFTTDVPGIHTAIATVDYGTCFTVESFDVAKNYEADLKTKVTCNPNGTFNVELLNHSKLFNIAQSAINFGYSGPLVPAGTNGQSYTVTGLSAGSHTFTLTLTSPGKPDCTATATVVLDPAPTVTFSIPQAEYCAEEPIPLTLPNPMVQGYRYEWHFNGTHYKASDATTLVQFSTGGSKPITLKIITPNGCEYITDTPVYITINKAEFDGNVTPNPLDFCEGSTVTPLQFNPFTGSATPTNAIWMRDDEPVHTGLTFTPTESGSYWPVLLDGDDCKFYGMVNNPVIVTVRKPPFASINGNTSVCYGESTTLTGIYTDAAVEHRWTLNGNALPGTLGSWITGPNDLTLTLSGLAPGNHNYAFETRHPNDLNCVNSFTAVVVFHPQLTTPTISVGLTNCQPYTLGLSANGPAAGTYTWSNGMVGQSIEVTHGGAYSVTYTAPTGCSVTAQVQAPHNPERTLWIVPQGCYRICASTGAYLLAPFGMYEQYEWFVNGGISQTGNNNFVPNQMVNQSGEYQLAIGQFGCMFYSNKPHIDLNYGCRPGATTWHVEPVTSPVVLTVSPNPATEIAVANFNVGTQYQHASGIAVYDVTGVQRLQQRVSGKQGEVQLNIGHLAPGTYMVNLQANGVNIAQQKLIKK